MSVLPGTMFRVALANDNLVLAHIWGKNAETFHLPDGMRSRVMQTKIYLRACVAVHNWTNADVVLGRPVA